MVRTATRITVEPGSHLLMSDVAWTTYSDFLKMFSESPAVRLTFDRGMLEIMSPSLHHDDESRFFVSLIQILAEEWGRPFKPGGSTTMRRKPKQAGLEADECFWLDSAPQMAGRRQLNLRRDPPPDLAIEVELRRSSINRMALFARLGVPEVWRLRKTGLTFHTLAGKKYDETATSVAFPGVTPALIEKFVNKAAEAGDVLGVLREFRVAARKCHAK